VTTHGVVVTLAFLAGIRLLSEGRFPGQIVEEVLAYLAVHSLGVVSTLAAAMDHAVFIVLLGKRRIHWQTLGGVAVAGAGSSHHHVGDAVVVLLLVLQPAVQKIVSQLVQLGHLNSEVSHL